MRRAVLPVLLALSTMIGGRVCAQNGGPPNGVPPNALAPEQDLKAAYLYHFVQFTQWPGPAAENLPVHICVDAAAPLTPALLALAERAGDGHPLVIDSGAAATTCHIWIAGRRPLPPELAAQPVLTVSVDSAALAPNVVIALYLRDGRVTFSINQTLARQRGLTISSKLLRLAEVVQ